MDSTSAEILSQVTSKMILEATKQHKLVREISLELQALCTALHHCNKDNMNLIRHHARYQQCRKSLEDDVLSSFKSTTKYARLVGQVEDVMQQYFVQFMKEKHSGLSHTGRPRLRLDFSDVKFSSSKLKASPAF